MKTRTLGRTGLQVSEIGLGCEHLEKKSERDVEAVVNAAIDSGMNIFDVFMSEPNVRTHIGKALGTRRKDVILQGHIGSTFADGQYKKDASLEQCKRFIDDFLTRVKTDYIDIGMLHFVDSEEDYHNYFEHGVIDYALQLKKDGVIRCVGMSSHNAITSKRAIETGLIDVLMFSINPLFDATPADTDIFAYFENEGPYNLTGVDPDRTALYSLCEEKGTAITVMKALAAGKLLSAEQSPFGVALTLAQCEHYALTRPAVSSVLIGCQSASEVFAAAQYDTAVDKDFAQIANAPAYIATGRCMYCNHCLPCPSGIDIAAVTKYFDLVSHAQNGLSATMLAHYDALGAHASDCIECGNCEAACPFGVSVIENMKAAASVFGR